MTEINNDTLITKTDRTGKREFQKKKNSKTDKIIVIRVRVMVSYATFNNISAIS
jgi:hypothetical protein